MFSFLGSLFGTQAAGARIVDGIAQAADKLIYTTEEKAEDAARARSEGFAVYTEWLKSTSGSRLARRMIALATVGTWVTEHLFSVALSVASVFAADPDQLQRASKILADNASDNNALVGVVLLFYFGGPVAMDGVKGLVNRWVNKGKGGPGAGQ